MHIADGGPDIEGRATANLLVLTAAARQPLLAESAQGPAAALSLQAPADAILGVTEAFKVGGARCQHAGPMHCRASEAQLPSPAPEIALSVAARSMSPPSPLLPICRLAPTRTS